MMSEMEWLDCFSSNLQILLKESGMTQKELAEESGLTEASISQYINKRNIPSVKAIINMAYALDCSVDELVDFEESIY